MYPALNIKIKAALNQMWYFGSLNINAYLEA